MFKSFKRENELLIENDHFKLENDRLKQIINGLKDENNRLVGTLKDFKREFYFINNQGTEEQKIKITELKTENEKLASQLIDAINISLMEEKINENKALTDNELKLWKIIYNKAYKKGYMDGYEKRIEDGWEDIEDDE